MPTIAKTFDQHYRVDPVTGCHIWLRAKAGGGYGQMGFGGKLVAAHRYAWFRKYGRWPVPFALHHCDNPPCVNAEHLFEGTQKQNAQDAIAKGRFVIAVSHKGEAHATAKMTETAVREMRKAFADGESTGSLARRFFISQPRAWRICKGIAWSHVTA